MSSAVLAFMAFIAFIACRTRFQTAWAGQQCRKGNVDIALDATGLHGFHRLPVASCEFLNVETLGDSLGTAGV